MSKRPTVITIQRRVLQHADIIAVVDFYSSDHETLAQTLSGLVREAPRYLEWRKAHPVTESPDDSA